MLAAVAFTFPVFLPATALFPNGNGNMVPQIAGIHFIIISHRFHLQIHNTGAKIGKIRIGLILAVIMIVNNEAVPGGNGLSMLPQPIPSGNNVKTIGHECIFYGIRLNYALGTVFGPVGLTVGYSNLAEKFYCFANTGYCF